MGEQAVTGAGATPAPEPTPAPDPTPAAGGVDAAAAGGPPPGPSTAGMTADGTATAAVPGAGMSADAVGGAQSRTADVTPGPGGVMTDEVGVVTGELTLRTDWANGQVFLSVQYKDADEWYAVTNARAPLPDPAGVDAVHTVAVGLLHRPEG